MATDFIVKESARQEVIKIVDWYDNQQTGLGDRFYKELLKEFDRIQRNPKVYTFYNKEFRRTILRNFPYLIIFKVTDHEIIIYSIVYGGRNPGLIKRTIT